MHRFPAPALAALCGLSVGAFAHDGVVHDSTEEAARHLAAGTSQEAGPVPDLPFPVQIDARFELTDQYGNRRTADDFRGRSMLIFFGYANCEAICSVALPRMAAALTEVDLPVEVLQPIMITVDPEADTVAALARRMPEIHPDLLGLTGDAGSLATAYDAFQVEVQELFRTADDQPIYAHGSFLYLIGPDGDLLSVLPPILSAERMAELITRYVTG